ncbi:MAG: thiamine-phosphate kinase [Bacillota bacterium]
MKVGEFELIKMLARVLGDPPGGIYRFIGDDTAVLEPPRGRLLFASDMVVEGIHFRLDFAVPWEVGWKALAVNVSDIAAMAGRPLYAVVSLGVSAEERPSELYEGIYRGMAAAASRYGVAIVGGDTVKTGGPLVIDVSIIGEAERPVLRCGARPGDLVAVTGALGASAAALEWFLSGRSREGPGFVDKAVQAHQAPEARVREAQAAAGTGGVTAMIDVSDGLAGDLGHICEESGLGALLDREVPVDPAARAMALNLGKDPLEWALHGGEDYQLLMTVDPARKETVAEAVMSCGTPLTYIGRMRQGEGVHIKTGDMEVRLGKGGYTHF